MNKTKKLQIKKKDTFKRKDTLKKKDTFKRKDTVKRKDTLKKKDTFKKGGTCKTKCKSDFFNEIMQNKKLKMIKVIASFFTKKDVVEEEVKSAIDKDKDIEKDEVFKDCMKTCKKKQ